jgi:hypothetical protein
MIDPSWHWKTAPWSAQDAGRELIESVAPRATADPQKMTADQAIRLRYPLNAHARRVQTDMRYDAGREIPLSAAKRERENRSGAGLSSCPMG